MRIAANRSHGTVFYSKAPCHAVTVIWSSHEPPLTCSPIKTTWEITLHWLSRSTTHDSFNKGCAILTFCILTNPSEFLKVYLKKCFCHLSECLTSPHWGQASTLSLSQANTLCHRIHPDNITFTWGSNTPPPTDMCWPALLCTSRVRQQMYKMNCTQHLRGGTIYIYSYESCSVMHEAKMAWLSKTKYRSSLGLPAIHCIHRAKRATPLAFPLSPASQALRDIWSRLSQMNGEGK